MVALVGKYYSAPSKGYHRFTQGYPLSPNIFNIVVDSVIRNWVVVVKG